MGDTSRDFAAFYGELIDRYHECGEDLNPFTPYEQETVALYWLNDDYGANGLSSYFAWHGRDLVALTLRGLARIGADRLGTLVSEYADLLERYGFRFGDQDICEFLDSLPLATQGQFDQRQAEAADLYGDFYDRWERYFASDSWRR